MRQQANLLNGIADLPTQDLGFKFIMRLSINQDFATADINQAVDHTQRGCLATAGRTDQNADLAVIDRHVQVVHGL